MKTKSQNLRSKYPTRKEKPQTRRPVQKEAESPARTLKITKKQITAAIRVDRDSDRIEERIREKYKRHGVVLAKLVDPSVFKRPLDFSKVPTSLPVPGRVPRYMRNLKPPPRVVSALRRAGELDSSVRDFCRRFPYAALKKSSHFNREIVLELMTLLTPLSAYSEAVGDWVASFPFPKLKLPDAEGRTKDRRK